MIPPMKTSKNLPFFRNKLKHCFWYFLCCGVKLDVCLERLGTTISIGVIYIKNGFTINPLKNIYEYVLDNKLYIFSSDMAPVVLERSPPKQTTQCVALVLLTIRGSGV